MDEKKLHIIEDNEINFRALFAILWNDKKKIFLIVLIFSIIGLINALSQTVLYKSTITIYPTNNNEISQMAEFKSMASAFGLSGAVPQNSIDIEDILYSNKIQAKLVQRQWNSLDYSNSVNLIDYWEKKSQEFSFSLNPVYWVKYIFSLMLTDKDTSSKDRYKKELDSISMLSSRIKVKKQSTGLYHISVLMEERKLASEIANFIHECLVEFNSSLSTNKNKLNREFIQERLIDVNNFLEAAEESLKDFREKNRNIVESPQLQLELGRLSRDVEVQNKIYLTLIEQFELLKIKELDEIPNLSVLDSAIPPLYKDEPKRKKIVLMHVLIGVMIGVAFTFSQFWYNQFFIKDEN